MNIYNAIVTGKPKCLTTETTQTETSLVGKESKLQYITLARDIDCKEGLYSSARFTEDANHNTINRPFTFSDVYVGTIDGGADLSSDKFFTAAAYQGAVKAGNDWTKGWTKK